MKVKNTLCVCVIGEVNGVGNSLSLSLRLFLRQPGLDQEWVVPVKVKNAFMCVYDW